MKTVGNLIKEARFRKNYSREKLSEITHIRVSFITAIENATWENLPEFSIVTGFVKTISHFLNIDANQAISLLRRDYPPKMKDSVAMLANDRQGPKTKEINKKFVWGPRLTFLAGILAVILIVLAYLGFQYKKFNSPPYLFVSQPTQNQKVTGFLLQVAGKTDPDATVTVNDQPVVLDSNGNFSTQIDLSKNTREVKIVAKSRSGKETVIMRSIINS